MQTLADVVACDRIDPAEAGRDDCIDTALEAAVVGVLLRLGAVEPRVQTRRLECGSGGHQIEQRRSTTWFVGVRPVAAPFGVPRPNRADGRGGLGVS